MSDPVIIGIDPSSRKLACVVTVGTEVNVHRLLLPPKKEAVTCFLVHSYMERLFSHYRTRHPDAEQFVFIEQVAGVVGKGGYKALIPQAEVAGAVLAACGKHDVPITKVPSGRWKKVVVGNGSATKQMVKAWVGQYWPNAYKLADGDQDLLDASCINRWGVKNYTSIQRRQKPRKTPTLSRK